MKFCIIKACSKISYALGLCRHHYSKDYRIKNRLKILENQAKYRRLHPEKKSINSMHKNRFGGLREFIIKRDGNKCLNCGMTREEHKKEFKRDITINHKDHQGRYANKQNNNPDNLETLCLRCHGSKDAIKHGKYSKLHVN